MLKRWMQGAMAATVALSAVGGIAFVAQAQTDIIKQRQDNRKEITRIGGREIRPLVKMVRPHIAIVTLIAAAHLGHFESLDDIARVRILHRNTQITVERTPKGWTVAESDGYPANTKAIQELLYASS